MYISYHLPFVSGDHSLLDALSTCIFSLCVMFVRHVVVDKQDSFIESYSNGQTYGIKTKQNEQRNRRQAATLPLIQRHRAIRVIVNLNHHVLKYLHSTARQALSSSSSSSAAAAATATAGYQPYRRNCRNFGRLPIESAC